MKEVNSGDSQSFSEYMSNRYRKLFVLGATAMFALISAGCGDNELLKASPAESNDTRIEQGTVSQALAILPSSSDFEIIGEREDRLLQNSDFEIIGEREDRLLR